MCDNTEWGHGGMTAEQWSNLFCNASPRPWRHEARDEFSGEDWLLASLGNGHDETNHYVCTDHIRCSEMVSGGAGEDAELIVALRNHGPALFRRLIASDAECQRLAARVAGLEAVLRSIEWGGKCGELFVVEICPVCGGSVEHEQGCALGAAKGDGR